MKLTGKFKEDFEKWLTHGSGMRFSERELFYNNRLTNSMQYGVFVDFLRYKNLSAKVTYFPEKEMYGFIIIETMTLEMENASHGSYHVHRNTQCEELYFNYESEAREEVIKAANNLYNNK